MAPQIKSLDAGFIESTIGEFSGQKNYQWDGGELSETRASVRLFLVVILLLGKL